MLNKNPLVMSVSLTVMCMTSFFLVLLFGAFLLQIGMQAGYIGILMLAFITGLYVFSGIFAKTMRLPAFQTAERGAQPFHSGQSIASGMISSGIFIFLAGQIYENGANALATYSGWILGACLMIVLFSTQVNTSGKPTLASLMQPGGNRNGLRLLTLLVVLLTCAPLLMMQFSMVGYLGEIFLGMEPSKSITIMALSIGICLILGGIQSLSVVRTLAYPIIAFAFLAPLAFIAYKAVGNPFPQLAYGTGALEPIFEIEREIIASGFASENQVFSLTKSPHTDMLGYVSILVCLACGTAAMPHLLQHFTTLKTAHDARRSGVWGFALMLVVITAVPAFAAFYRIDIYTSLLGLQIADIEAEASWIYSLSGNSTFKAIAICGQYVAGFNDVLSACGQNADYYLTSQDISVNPALLVLSTGIMNDLPAMATWLLVTGAFIAIWSTADGIAFSMANTLCHDGYVNMIRPNSPQSIRLFVGRFLLVIIIATFAMLTVFFRPEPQLLFEVTFAMASASLFTALAGRVWSTLLTDTDIMTGMVCGFVVTACLLALMQFGFDGIAGSGDELRLTLEASIEKPTLMSAGLIGTLLSVLGMYGGHFARKGLENRKKRLEEEKHVSNEPETV